MKAENIPDEIEIQDPDGNLITVYRPQQRDKETIARYATRWHQSLEKTLNRFIRNGLRERQSSS